ncbi:cation:proton antiporter [Streptomyces sp. A1499]|uniref:cation:proton antiporter domain-containing protein n=1 Tax=Streptomyces sp. A1499 TaxID=2563104 RepID=UPI00109ECA82|nr:cation:proton antiporter [Streptomyces sp. A1499]THC47300.1 sodium:proton exchanger [Streptomyces sp. A1499]
MIPVLIVITAVMAGWSLLAGRLEQLHVRAPLVLVLAGVATGLFTHSEIAVALNSKIALHVAEITLAVLLFVDATELRGGRLFGRDPGSAARLLLVALPLGLGATVLLAGVLLPELSAAVLLLIACVVTPTDFAPAESLVRDRRIPARVRNVLNVESGYNDGIVSPIFLFALVLAGSTTEKRTPSEALATTVPFAVKALVIGALIGALLAWLMNLAQRANLMSDQSRRIIGLVIPLLTYTSTVAVHGNGFVAAFVAGVAFRYVRRAGQRHGGGAPAGSDLQLVEDTSALMTMVMWFFFGNAVVLAFVVGFDWSVLLLCAAALTVLRIVPVFLALLGSRLGWRERLLIGALGPRGTTSIVFGLLAFNAIPDGPGANSALEATVLVVLGSLLLHGGGSMAIARLLRVKPRPRTFLAPGTEPAAETTPHHASSSAGAAVTPGAAGDVDPAAGTAEGGSLAARRPAADPPSE